MMLILLEWILEESCEVQVPEITEAKKLGNMLKDKALLTYKRKRFSFQNNRVHDSKETNLSSNVQNESLWISIPKSEFDANNEKAKNHHSEKCQCSTSNSIYDFSESMPKNTPETKRMRQSHISRRIDIEPMILRSHKVLTCIKTENISLQATSTTVPGTQSVMGDIIQGDSSGPKTELDCMTSALESSTSLMTIAININENVGAEGGFNSKCPELGAKINKLSCKSDNDGALKGLSSAAPLITFSRRGKTKQDISERITGRNSAIMEKQSFSAICNTHVAGADFSCEISSLKCISEEHVSSAPILLNSYAATSSQVDTEEMANVKVEATSELNSEIHTKSKIEKTVKTSSELLLPPLSAGDTSEKLSKECPSVQLVHNARDVGDSIYPLNITEPLNSVNNGIILSDKESGRKLINGSNNCKNLGAVKLSDNPMPENPRDSQSSSTPCCSIVFMDEENEGRSKEIEWLESLDNVLRENKNDRDACSLMVQDVEICKEFSSMMANKSARQPVNDKIIGIDFMNQLSVFPEKKSLKALTDPRYDEQPKPIKPTLFTDFLGRSPPSSLGTRLGLNTDAVTPLCSRFTDTFNRPDGKLLWPSNVNPSFFQHRHISENTIAEILRRIPKGRHSAEWSEEELDSLWIGVRRHGVDKWNAFLRDPKLEFVPSRLPEDLASQWDREQKKLFNGTPSQIFKPTTFLTPLPETKLSLGDVYRHEENLTRNSQVCTAGYPQTCDSSSTCSFLGNYFPMPSIRSNNYSASSKAMYQMNHGFPKQSTAGFPASTNLPHWLKEACASHPTPSDSPWPAFFSSGITANLANNNDSSEPLSSSKDLRSRGILKMRSTKLSGKKPRAVKIEEAPASIEEPLCGKLSPASVHRNILTDLRTNICVPIVSKDLVVIDSDVSSEETISDDQNRRL